MNKNNEEFDLNKYSLKEFLKKRKSKKQDAEKAQYTVYNSNEFATISNRFVEPLTVYLLGKYPALFKPLDKDLKLARMNMLSKSYISMTIFATLISFFVGTLLFSLVFLNPLKALPLGLLTMIITFVTMYFYPKSVVGTISRKIKSELPFAVVHMAGIAGSGAMPESIFKLLIESEEYPELGKEFKKIVNYLNLFGYNLTTALKAVAESTPSKEFAELLNGIISTVESGGDLNNYLNDKAEDSLATYKLDRQKYVESLATYSDIYTSLLVAAPLLFVITLTIINAIGGKIGGLSVTTISYIGTFVVLPLLNLGFIFFLTITQPE